MEMPLKHYRHIGPAIVVPVAHTLLTNQARVLLAVAGDCNVRMRDLADQVGLTERAVYDALSDLIEGGYLERERVGRRNCYRLVLEPRDGELEEVEAVAALAALLASRQHEATGGARSGAR